MNRGTVVLTRFSFTDLTTSKRRPAVVVSKYSSSKSDVIVAFITSVIPTKLNPTDLLFLKSHPDFFKSGLKHDSLIKLDKLATLNKTIFAGELGKLSPLTMKEINKKLMVALDLD